VSRMSQLRDDIEAGRDVDLNRLHTLLALDAAVTAEEYVARANQDVKDADDELIRLLSPPTS